MALDFKLRTELLNTLLGPDAASKLNKDDLEGIADRAEECLHSYQIRAAVGSLLNDSKSALINSGKAVSADVLAFAEELVEVVVSGPPDIGTDYRQKARTVSTQVFNQIRGAVLAEFRKLEPLLHRVIESETQAEKKKTLKAVDTFLKDVRNGD